MAILSINIDRLRRDIDNLARFTRGPGPGVTRLTFSEEDRAARAYLRDQMEAIGLRVVELPPGIMIGRLESTTAGGPAVMAGSHIDSVLQGGRFDGIVGVAGALEVARVLVDNQVPIRNPYEVVILPEEEGTSFGAVLTGSKAWVGQLTSDRLGQMRRADGVTYLEAMERYGLPASGLDAHRLHRGRAKAFLELHIEQSVVLEEAAVQIGVVTTVTGIRGFDATLVGIANHAGATPMARRRAAHGRTRTVHADAGCPYGLHGRTNRMQSRRPQCHSRRGPAQHRLPRHRESGREVGETRVVSRGDRDAPRTETRARSSGRKRAGLACSTASRSPRRDRRPPWTLRNEDAQWCRARCADHGERHRRRNDFRAEPRGPQSLPRGVHGAPGHRARRERAARCGARPDERLATGRQACDSPRPRWTDSPSSRRPSSPGDGAP